MRKIHDTRDAENQRKTAGNEEKRTRIRKARQNLSNEKFHDGLFLLRVF